MDPWRMLAVMILLRAMQDSIGNGLALGGSNTNGKRDRVIDGGKEWPSSDECDLCLKGLGYPWNRYTGEECLEIAPHVNWRSVKAQAGWTH